MSRYFLTLVLFFSMVGMCYAEVFVLYDSATGEVKSAINKDVAVLEQGWDKAVLPGKLKDYGLQKHSQYYKFIDGNFVQDNDKISKETNDKKKAKDVFAEMQLIRNKSYKTACEALELENVNFKEIKCSDF